MIFYNIFYADKMGRYGKCEICGVAYKGSCECFCYVEEMERIALKMTGMTVVDSSLQTDEGGFCVIQHLQSTDGSSIYVLIDVSSGENERKIQEITEGEFIEIGI